MQAIKSNINNIRWGFHKTHYHKSGRQSRQNKLAPRNDIDIFRYILNAFSLMPKKVNKTVNYYFTRLTYKFMGLIVSLRKKCPNTEFFLVCIQYEYREMRTRKNYVFGHFSRSV